MVTDSSANDYSRMGVAPPVDVHDYKAIGEYAADEGNWLKRARGEWPPDTDRALLEALCIPEPWSSSYEGLDDECMFCGSCDRTYDSTGYRADPPRPEHTYRHEPNCVWIRAMDHLDRPHPEHTTEPRPPRVDRSIVCDVCDRTFGAHMAHLSMEAGRELAKAQEDSFLRAITGIRFLVPPEIPGHRPVAAEFPPLISAPRGGIRFVVPPEIPG